MFLKNLLKLIGPWLLKQLIPVLDPEASARAEALQKKIEAAEQREKEAEEIQRQADLKYAAAEQHRREQDAKIAEADLQLARGELALRESEARRVGLQTRRKEIEDAIEKDKAAIDARSDDDAFSGRLPGSG